MYLYICTSVRCTNQMATTTTRQTEHIRAQKKGQNARQAMVISGLNTIYRTNTMTHAIQTHRQTEPRIYLLNITLQEMNEVHYPKIHQIIERGCLRPKGTELYFVEKRHENIIITEDGIYELCQSRSHMKGPVDQEQTLRERIPFDGETTTLEIIVNCIDSDTQKDTQTIPVLVDESYYELTPAAANGNGNAPATHTPVRISPNHILHHSIKKVVKTNVKSTTAFVFIFNEDESKVIDFYITTENGIIPQKEKLTRTCKDDIISFLVQFKLCS